MLKQSTSAEICLENSTKCRNGTLKHSTVTEILSGAQSINHQLVTPLGPLSPLVSTTQIPRSKLGGEPPKIAGLKP